MKSLLSLTVNERAPATLTADRPAAPNPSASAAGYVDAAPVAKAEKGRTQLSSVIDGSCQTESSLPSVNNRIAHTAHGAGDLLETAYYNNTIYNVQYYKRY